MRASHRKLSLPPFKYMGLPYHRSYAEDIEPIPEGEPVELVFDLHPTSNIFDAGHSIRITVTCADQNNYDTPELFPAPVVTVYRNSTYASCISLPVISEQTEIELKGLYFLVIVVVILGLVLVVIFLTIFMKSRRE